MGLKPSGKCYESSRIHLQYETDYFLSFLSFLRNFFGGTWNWRGTDSLMPNKNRLSYGTEYWVWWQIVYRRGHPTSQSRSENTQLQDSGRYSYTNIHNLHLTSPWGRPLLRAWASNNRLEEFHLTQTSRPRPIDGLESPSHRHRWTVPW